MILRKDCSLLGGNFYKTCFLSNHFWYKSTSILPLFLICDFGCKETLEKSFLFYLISEDKSILLSV